VRVFGETFVEHIFSFYLSLSLLTEETKILLSLSLFYGCFASQYGRSSEAEGISLLHSTKTDENFTESDTQPKFNISEFQFATNMPIS